MRMKSFYPIREVNYPRAWASSIRIDDSLIYLFGGFN